MNYPQNERNTPKMEKNSDSEETALLQLTRKPRGKGGKGGKLECGEFQRKGN